MTASAHPQAPGEDVAWLGVRDLASAYRSRALSPIEVTEALCERAEVLDRHFTVFLTRTPEVALERARSAEARLRAEPDAPPLIGVPTTIKDLVATRGIRTTMGAATLREWVPDFDTPVSERIASAGCPLLGKTNTCEYGWKGDAGNLIVGPTANPFDAGRTAGGSSGGAAAAVALGLGPVAHGTDGAGSVRIPAAFCGVVGMKPSFGRIPYYPASAVSWFAHHGALARTVEDAWLLVRALSGADERDPFSYDPVDAALPDVRGLRVGFVRTFGDRAPDPSVLGVVERTISAMERDLGIVVEVVEGAPADPYEALETLWAAAHAARMGDVLDAPSPDVDPGLLRLARAARAYDGMRVARALIARTAYIEALRILMQRYEALITPTVPSTAFALGLDRPEPSANDAGVLSWTPNTYPFNITGAPAVSVPCGQVDGLPVGVQFAARWRRDEIAVALALQCERLIGGFRRPF